jgi:hypothetical protein
MKELKKRILEREPQLLKQNYQNLINKISIGDFNMSFSALKNFSISPLSFIKYKCREKKDTDALKLGRLTHLLILEPHLFDEKYIIIQKAKGFEGNNWAKKENKDIKVAAEAKAVEQGKEVIQVPLLEEALEFKDAVLGNSSAGDVVRGCTVYEKSLIWEAHGYTWRGFIDGYGKRYSFDLKKVRDARTRKMRWVYQDEKFHWQGYLYNTATSKYKYKDFYIIAYDGDLNVNVIKIDQYDLMRAEAEINDILKHFNQCAISEQWMYSLEYWTEEGYVKSSEI